jgi:trk system potassium uptake protein TrkH
VLLTVGFAAGGMGFGRSVFYGLFHSVSAFCNAGFALFSDSLEGFRLHPLVMGTIGSLIVLGGLGFGVILNLLQYVGHAVRLRGRSGVRAPTLALNTRVVLRLTLLLLVGGTVLIYALEHGNSMATYGLAEQYGAALFQAVTLRTAGFNSIPFGGLRDATYLLMVVFMFIGGASGSTAGGIKVNTVGVLGAYVASVLRDEEEARIGQFVITREKVARAFLVLLTAISAAAVGAFLLALTENAAFLHLLFETVSALGTVGLSAGVTGSLTVGGKLIIVVLMFVGRLGALTLLTALRRTRTATGVAFPSGDIAIG